MTTNKTRCQYASTSVGQALPEGGEGGYGVHAACRLLMLII
jgi:hypothetical protein